MSFFIPNFYLCIIPLVESNDTVEVRFTRKIKHLQSTRTRSTRLLHYGYYLLENLQILFSSKVFNRRREQVLVFISWDVLEETVFITF